MNPAKSSYLMSHCLYILLFVLGTINCSSQSSNNQGVSIVKRFPISYNPNQKNTTASYITDTISIFTIDNYLVYRTSPIQNFNTVKNLTGTEPLFVLKKGDSVGYWFQTVNDSSNGYKLNADSFVTASGFKQSDLDFPKESYGYTKSVFFQDIQSGLRIEKFIPAHKTQEGEPDTLTFCFSSRFPKVDYTFSKKLDSLYGMKLYEVNIFFKEAFSVEQKTVLPDREIQLALLSLGPVIPPNILSLVERCRKIH
ncbi:MAG: hypothetical protein ABI581_01330 [Sediminibacterium sp.]